MNAGKSLAEECPIISFRALNKARTTIEDFAMMYFPLLDLSMPEDFFKYWDVLVFAEAVIYSVDIANEELAGHQNSEQTSSAMQALATGEQVLLEVLQKQGVWNAKIHTQWLQAKQFWSRERQFCSAMRENPKGPAFPLSLEDIMKISESKSFDYRLLNLILHAVSQKQPDPALLAFLQVDEHLVDIGDDLFDYEDDILDNSFNVLRGYVRISGSSAADLLVSKIAELEHRHHDLLLRLPTEVQAKYLKRQRSAAQEDGSLRWKFPALIYDEDQFREQVKAAGQPHEP